VRVSKCPMCRYSLRDLADDAPCPECGEVIDRVLLRSPNFTGPVSETRYWCTLGTVGWITIALTVLVSIVSVASPVDLFSYAGFVAAFFISIPLVFAGCLQIWAHRARRRVYQALKKSRSGRVQVQIRVMALASVGMLVGVICIGVLIKEIGRLA
jgi:hypothetical protein